MAAPSHEGPNSPDGWITIAERELRNLRGSYVAKLSNDAKVDHALRATEAVLKAIIWKHEGWLTWPSKVKKQTNFLYKHNLDVLLDRCGMRTRLQMSLDHNASWQVLVNALVKQSRYSPTPPSDSEANAVARSTRHPDIGVVPWLLKHYRKMN